MPTRDTAGAAVDPAATVLARRRRRAVIAVTAITVAFLVAWVALFWLGREAVDELHVHHAEWAVLAANYLIGVGMWMIVEVIAELQHWFRRHAGTENQCSASMSWSLAILRAPDRVAWRVIELGMVVLGTYGLTVVHRWDLSVAMAVCLVAWALEDVPVMLIVRAERHGLRPQGGRHDG